MKKEKVILKAIDWAQKKGMHNIKSIMDDYEDPTSFIHQKTEKPMIPDVTGFLRNKKRYIEIADRNTENLTRTITKWKLLSTIAMKKGSKLFILAPHGHKAFAERVVDKYQISSQVITLS
jgi:hypothetical protein